MMTEQELKVLVFDILEAQERLKLQYDYLDKQRMEVLNKLAEVRKANASAPPVPAEPVPAIEEQ